MRSIHGEKNMMISDRIQRALKREGYKPDSLDLSGSGLTSLPAVIGQLSRLTHLNLSRNKLKSLPTEIGMLASLNDFTLLDGEIESLPTEIGKLTNLEALHLKSDEFKSLPTEIGQLIRLTKLLLYGTKLTFLPTEIGNLISLEGLYVNVNRQLTSLPTELGRLTRLKELRLIENSLESLPHEIGNLILLERLDVAENKLKFLPPEIGLCRNITYLNIPHNPDLRELPMSIGQIPRVFDLNIEGTGIIQVMRDSILSQCRLLRDQNALKILPNRLKAWIAWSGDKVDLTKIEAGTPHQINEVNEWLTRLERTRDFCRSQQKLALIVCKMLESVCENEEFRELFFIQIAANNVSCEDRAAMALNEIYTSWKIVCLPEASLKTRLKILAGAAKTAALRIEIGKCLPKEEQESVEIYLYFETLLKEQLDLCTVMENMAYSDIGKRSWIDVETLVKKVDSTYFTYLLALPPFERIVKTALKSEWDKIEMKACDELEDLGERPLGDDLSESVLSWSHQLGKVMQEKESAWATACHKWFTYLLRAQ